MNTPAQAEPPDLARSLRLVGVSSFVMTRREITRHAGFGHWLFELFTDGALAVQTVASGWQVRTAGSGVLYPPGVSYRERIVSDGRRRRPCRSICLFFDADDPALLAPLIDRSQQARMLEDPHALLRPLIERLERSRGAGDAGSLMALGCFYQVIALLLAAARRAGASGALIAHSDDTTGMPPPLTEALAYMREHLHEPGRLREVAAHIGMSESGLAHAWRRHTWTSPMAAWRAMRVEAAKSLLLRYNLTIAQAAERTGFADGFHLSRAFKQQTGRSPRAFVRGKAE